MQAYASLGSGSLLKDSRIQDIATHCGKTGAMLDTYLMLSAVSSDSISVQCGAGAAVLLQWALQHGVGVIPRSTDPTRLALNRAAVEEVRNGTPLSEEHMAMLDALGGSAEESATRRVCWDPRTVT